MTQGDKELLLKDLCARLLYGVKCHVPSKGKIMTLTGKRLNYLCFHDDECVLDYRHEYETVIDPLNDSACNYVVKPYLRPLSSMTEDELGKLKGYSGLIYDQLDLASFQNGTYKCLDFYLNEVPAEVVVMVFDWLNRNHFDYRNLIVRGLALDCTGLNVY